MHWRAQKPNKQQLSNSIADDPLKWFLAMVDQQDLYFASIVGVNETGSVRDRQSVASSESGAWNDQAGGVLRQGQPNSGRH
jgi:hypothetical protein